MLNYNGHLLWMLSTQIVIKFNTVIAGDKADVKMRLTRQANIFSNPQ